MQVEARVEHIEPRPHDGDTLDRAAVDLDDARVADKHHDGRAVGRRPLQQHAGRVRVHALRELRRGEMHRGAARQAMLAQQAEELVRVAQRGPAGTEGAGVDIGRIDRCGRRLVAPLWRGRGGVGPADAQRLPRGQVGARPREDLVHRHAPRIEELQALLLALRRRLMHSIAVGPVAVEQPQVDLLAQRHAHLAPRFALGAELLVDAGAFMHAMGIARQCHHLAGVPQRGQQGGKVAAQALGLQATGRCADMGVDEHAFGDAEGEGDVAVPGMAGGTRVEIGLAQIHGGLLQRVACSTRPNWRPGAV
mmetsp:Transcript_5758/g.14048  ORF Transcript_5758/g.14048 Transcript_5758/m.14048 type:complete len:307 (-) Transcript_5758:1616-2536(-)